MLKREAAWHSSDLGIEMPIAVYGHSGVPLLMFPTAAADYLEYERFLLIDAIARHIDSGRVRVYTINSVNRYGLMNDQAPPQLKARLLATYDSYITHDVIPWIRSDCDDPQARPLTAGASLGAFAALNSTLKHPDLIQGCIAMSGSYDVRDYLAGYDDDDIYYNNPADYMRNLDDDTFLPRLRESVTIVLVTGQGAYESPGRSVQMAAILREKGIPCTLDLWGLDVAHDWPWWRRMLDYYLGKVVPAAPSATRHST
jgi:esterase/lipase superfamily enzyme